MDAVQPDGELAEWVTLDSEISGFLRLRHGFLGELLLHADARKAHGVDLAKLTKNLLIAISDRVGHDGIRRKDFYYRAASQLMDLQLVQKVVNSNDVDAWYEEIREPYAWNARYWEQRALGLTDQLDRAYSYAQRAVSKHADAFTYNTLGTVLMRRASHRSTPSEARQRYWGEANKALLKSRSDGRGRFDFPFLTYMTFTVRVLEAAGTLDEAWEQEMRSVTRSWIKDADAAGLRADRDLEGRIQALPDGWTRDLPRTVKRKDLEARPDRPRRRTNQRGGRSGPSTAQGGGSPQKN